VTFKFSRKKVVPDFKLSLCSECRILSFPRHLKFMCRRFRTLCTFHLHRSCEQEESTGRSPPGYSSC